MAHSELPKVRFVKAWWDPAREGCYFVQVNASGDRKTFFTKHGNFFFRVPSFTEMGLDNFLHKKATEAGYRLGLPGVQALLQHIKEKGVVNLDSIVEVEEPALLDAGRSFWQHLEES